MELKDDKLYYLYKNDIFTNLDLKLQTNKILIVEEGIFNWHNWSYYKHHPRNIIMYIISKPTISFIIFLDFSMFY